MNAPLPCPIAEHCESCGDLGDLAVHTALTAVGQICLTLCTVCAEDGCTPPMDCPTGVHRALIHREHLYTVNGDHA